MGASKKEQQMKEKGKLEFVTSITLETPAPSLELVSVIHDSPTFASNMPRTVAKPGLGGQAPPSRL